MPGGGCAAAAGEEGVEAFHVGAVDVGAVAIIIIGTVIRNSNIVIVVIDIA